MRAFVFPVFIASVLTVGTQRFVSMRNRRGLLKSIEKICGKTRSEESGADVYESLRPLLYEFHRRAPVLLQLEPISAIRKRLALAGDPFGLDGEEFLSIKNLSGLGLAILSLMTLSLTGLLAMPLMFITGFFIPEIYIRVRLKRRQTLMALEIPEAVELIAILVAAGLNLNMALARTGTHLPGLFGEEIKTVSADIELGIPRRMALQSLSERVQSDDVKRFVSTILQAERYGTPLGESLKVLAEESRAAQTRRIKEDAQKIPVKMLFPLVFLVLPSFILLTVGPLVLTSFMLY